MVDKRSWNPAGAISVVVPVLNEYGRLGNCLERLIGCGSEVGEILVVDGGSTDGTQKIVQSFAETDPRVRLDRRRRRRPPAGTARPGTSSAVSSHHRPTPNGSPRSMPTSAFARRCWARWSIMRSTANFAHSASRRSKSWATPARSIVHPSMLTTLVYRHGLPGQATRNVADVQANGQCFLARRDLLNATNAFAKARSSGCEDVTIARVLARSGARVGFYEAGDLAVVRMHETGKRPG